MKEEVGGEWCGKGAPEYLQSCCMVQAWLEAEYAGIT